jgi:DNA-directed RNA polymerase specialized sigma subunit
MSERSKLFMEKIWEERNTGADTEEKLVSSILKLIPNIVRQYNTQNGISVLDVNDLITLSEELTNPET